MEFALLGSDYESVSLATAAVSQGHQITWCGDADWAREQYQLPWLAQRDQHPDWESLLDSHYCDAVIVGRGEAPAVQRVEQVNLLVKNGIALLTTFPLVESVLSYYEIDMGREESGALLRHFNPLTEQQALVEQCRDWVSGGHPQLGEIERILWERPLADRNREQVLWHFARDVSLLSLVAGRLHQLGAHGSGDERTTYSGLSVQLIGQCNLPVQWSVGPGGPSDTPHLVFAGQKGKLAVHFDDESRPVNLEITRAEDRQTIPVESTDPAESSIRGFTEAFKQRGRSTWTEALQAMELADTIEISLRRGRMISVHHQQLTEDLAFRGTMSAAGCGVLLVLPALLLLLGWLAELLGLPVASYWPHVLLALLSVFLLVQLLPKLFLRPRGGNKSTKGD